MKKMAKYYVSGKVLYKKLYHRIQFLIPLDNNIFFNTIVIKYIFKTI